MINDNNFTVYDSQKYTVLELLQQIVNRTSNVENSLKNKTDLHGDHKGSWQGLNKPTLSDEGMRATVEKHIVDISSLQNEDVAIKGTIISEVEKLQNEDIAIRDKIDLDFVNFNEAIQQDLNQIRNDVATELSVVSKYKKEFAELTFCNTTPHEDCMLLTTHNNKKILIDCGEPVNGGAILNNITKCGVDKLDVLILTHFHSDHAGNGARVIERFRPKIAYYKAIDVNQLPPQELQWKTDVYYNEFLKACADYGVEAIPLTRDLEITFSINESIQILNATMNMPQSINQNSLMVLHTIGKCATLLGGDTTSNVLDTYVDRIPTLNLFKIPHHGLYAENMSRTFIKKKLPLICHISTVDSGVGKDHANQCKAEINKDVYLDGIYAHSFGYILTPSGVIPTKNTKHYNFIDSHFKVDNKYWYCNNSGHLVGGGIENYKGKMIGIIEWEWQINKWFEIQGHKYCSDIDGYIYTDKWIQSADPSTPNAYYRVDGFGRMLKSCKFIEGNTTYNLDSYGIASPIPGQ